MFRKSYGEVFAGDERWNALEVPTGERFEWDADSTYVRLPPYFQEMPAEPRPVADIEGARVLAKLGDSVTTDHISPAGAIKRDGPAGRYLQEQGVAPARLQLLRLAARQPRGDDARHLRQHPHPQPHRLAPAPEGGSPLFRHPRASAAPDEVIPIYDAAMRYAEEDVPLVVLAGKEYGSGSSRDWAAKGTEAARRARGDRARASSASTAPTSSAWASCRCSSPRVRAPRSWV